jgi:hypothetical protein
MYTINEFGNKEDIPKVSNTGKKAFKTSMVTAESMMVQEIILHGGKQ